MLAHVLGALKGFRFQPRACLVHELFTCIECMQHALDFFFFFFTQHVLDLKVEIFLSALLEMVPVFSYKVVTHSTL